MTRPDQVLQRLVAGHRLGERRAGARAGRDSASWPRQRCGEGLGLAPRRARDRRRSAATPCLRRDRRAATAATRRAPSGDGSGRGAGVNEFEISSHCRDLFNEAFTLAVSFSRQSGRFLRTGRAKWDAINMTFTLMSECWRDARDAASAPQFGKPMAALILVVDDDPIQRRLLEAMTRRFGYESETAEFGRGGAGAARGARPSAGQSGHSRSRHARSRRHGRARPHAPARHRDAGDRADRARLDRGGDLGDARRRDRFRRQAGRGRAAAGLDQERAAGRRARRRAAPRQPAQRRRARLPRHRHPRRSRWRARMRLAERAAKSNIPGADRRRIRRRQGAAGARDPGRLGAARQAVRHRQLRRACRKPGRVDPVRPREGRLHRRDREARRQVRRGQRRHAVPRRDRRTAARGAGQAAARAAGGRDRPGRRAPLGQGRFARSSRRPTRT